MNTQQQHHIFDNHLKKPDKILSLRDSKYPFKLILIRSSHRIDFDPNAFKSR